MVKLIKFGGVQSENNHLSMRTSFDRYSEMNITRFSMPASKLSVFFLNLLSNFPMLLKCPCEIFSSPDLFWIVVMWTFSFFFFLFFTDIYRSKPN